MKGCIYSSVERVTQVYSMWEEKNGQSASRHGQKAGWNSQREKQGGKQTAEKQGEIISLKKDDKRMSMSVYQHFLNY